MPNAWINGVLVPESEAMVSIADRGFQVGFGVFETVLSLAGKPVFLDAHLERLTGACLTMNISMPRADILADAVEEVLSSHSLDRLRLRIQVTPTTAVIIASPAPAPEGMLDVVTAPWSRNERSALAGMKVVSYAENIFALEHARRLGAREVLIGNTQGHLCEGATTNVFAVFEGRLCTPPLASGCLPGTARAIVSEICMEQGITLSEEDIPMKYLSDRTEEMFLTSSLRMIQSVARIDGKPVDHAPGRFAPALLEAFVARISAEQ